MARDILNVGGFSIIKRIGSGARSTIYSATDVKLLIDDIFLRGDYNRNGFVDTPDYVVWRKMLGLAGPGLLADGTGPGGVPDGIVNSLDYDFWKARFGNVVKGGEIIMTGSSTLTANGLIVGERTKGLLSVGPNAVVDLRTWDTLVEEFGGTEDMRIGNYGPAYDDFGDEPGLDGIGLVDVEGALNAKDVYLSENGAKGEIRLSGGS